MELDELNDLSPATQLDQPPATGRPTHGVIGHLSSDEELQQAVCSALLQTPGLDASAIQVVVLAHGEVTLLGRVPTAHQRASAIRVARDCAAGRTVHADLIVAAPHSDAG